MRAIDMHVHVPRQPGLPEIEVEPHLRRYFKTRSAPKDAAELAAKYAEWDILGVIFSLASGDPFDSNDYIAQIVSAFPGQFIGFATLDSWRDDSAVDELERSVAELGLRGLKLHPIHQELFPNDTRIYPLYEKCVEMEVPVLFHTGFPASGAGLPGGGGFKLKYSAPIPGIDDVAADFPNLTIIMAHPAWPWIQEQIAVVLHKANVYMDLSGWSPRYIPKVLIKEANGRLKDKILFGSDFPFLPPDRWLREFEDLPITEEVRPKILLDNARRALRLGES